MNKRPAPDNASDAPATKPRTDNPDQLPPQKLTIKKKDPITTVLTSVSDGSRVRAKSPQPDAEKTVTNEQETLTNEFRILEPPTDAMEEDSEPHTERFSPLRTADIRKCMLNNSPIFDAPAVETSNRYEPLADIETEEHITPGSSAHSTRPRAPNAQKPPTKPVLPPPIVIVGNDNGNLMTELDKITSRDYWTKNTANSVVLHTKNMQDYESVIRWLNQSDTHYHTYSASGRRTHAFVLRGMRGTLNEQSILTYINANSNVTVHRVFRMKTLGVPLFLVITDATMTVSKLQKEVPFILRSEATWENRKSANPITQCRRCQTWGHSSNNCRRTYRCSKCAQPHNITECKHTGPPVCANCRQQHRAFSRQCPVYLNKLSQYEAKFPPPQAAKPTYMPAPPPVNPAWNPRRGQLPPQPTQTGPAHLNANYDVNFPGAPGFWKNPNANAANPPTNPQPSQNQTASRPVVAAATAAGPASQFNVLMGKWNEVSSLINFQNMIKALDTYITMLRSATCNNDLFVLSQEFFCNVLPSINLAP